MKLEQYAKEKGYFVTKGGECFSPNGNKLGKSKNKEGYRQFAIRFNGTPRKLNIHRLQAYQKYGENIFKEGVEVRHLNGDKSDNSFENICIGSHKENMMDIPKEKRLSISLHATYFWRKHNREEIKKFHNKNKSYRETKEKFGISSSGTLHFILNG